MSSEKMKRWIGAVVAGLFAAGAVADQVLVGFDKCSITKTYSNRTAMVELAGFDGVQQWSDNGALGDDWKLTGPGWGSQDGTFGSLATGATTGSAGDDGGFWTANSTNASYMDITVQNGSSDSYELTHFCFDAWRQWLKGCEGYSVSVVAGDLALVDDFATGTFKQNSSVAGYVNYDVSLAGLPDNVLAAGEEATFRLLMRDSAPAADGQLFVDNIAILGVEYTPKSGSVLLGFDKIVITSTYPTKSPRIKAPGFDGLQTLSYDTELGDEWGFTRHSGGSTDGSFGSLADGATTGSAGNDGAFWTANKGDDSYMDIRIDNKTATSYELTCFCFDAFREYAVGSDGYTLSVVAGDWKTVENFATGDITSMGKSASSSNYEDFDIYLSELPETILAAGESVTFRLRVTDRDPSSRGRLNIDNIAIMGMAAGQTL